MQNECQQIVPLPAFKQKQPFWKKQNHMFMALPKPPIEMGCAYVGDLCTSIQTVLPV